MNLISFDSFLIFNICYLLLCSSKSFHFVANGLPYFTAKTKQILNVYHFVAQQIFSVFAKLYYFTFIMQLWYCLLRFCLYLCSAQVFQPCILVPGFPAFAPQTSLMLQSVDSGMFADYPIWPTIIRWLRQNFKNLVLMPYFLQ